MFRSAITFKLSVGGFLGALHQLLKFVRYFVELEECLNVGNEFLMTWTGLPIVYNQSMISQYFGLIIL